MAHQRAQYRARVGGRGDTRRVGFETGLRAPVAHRARRVVRSLFFKEEMELSLIGLNAAGKTSLVNVIAVRRASASGSSARGGAVGTAQRCARPRVHARSLGARVCVCGGDAAADALGAAFTQTGSFSEDMIPTVGFNMRKVTKGNVSIKVRCASCCSCCAAR